MTTQLYKPSFVLLAALSLLPLSASAEQLLGANLASFSVLAGGYATYGASAMIGGNVGAIDYVVGGAGSKTAGDFTNTPLVNSALSELSSAQNNLKSLGNGTALSTSMTGSLTFAPGVYSASSITIVAGTNIVFDGGGLSDPFWVFNIPTYLVTGAGTTMSIKNAGSNAQIAWNTGGYATLGADTQFVGAIVSGGYINSAAGANIFCGNAFASGYISVAAGSAINSTNCGATDTWAGSVNGLGSNMDIVNGAVVPISSGYRQSVVQVPEPKAYLLLLAGLCLIGMMAKRRKDW